MVKVDILGVQHDYALTPVKPDTEITVVFVHGWLLSRHYWQPVIEQVQSKFTCLCYDLRGFGDSGCLADTAKHQPLSLPDIQDHYLAALTEARCRASNFSPAAYGRDLLLLLDALNLKRVWLVGHSLGGAIAVWAAAINGASSPIMDGPRVEGVIGLNSGGGLYVEDEFKKFRTAGQQILKFRPRWLSRVPGLDWIFSRSNVATAVSRDWGQQLLLDFLRTDVEAGRRALLDSTTPEEVMQLPGLVQSLKQPAYFLAGDRDRVMAPKFVHHLASFHSLFQESGDNVFELSDCGHLGMIEQPQQVSDLILKLVHRHRESSPFQSGIGTEPLT